MTKQHPVGGLDDVVHQRHRLGILVVLREADRAEFTYLRDILGLTDGNLGRHLDVLQSAGLVRLDKAHDRRRQRTTATITAKGRRALAQELAVLEDLVERSHRRLRSV